MRVQITELRSAQGSLLVMPCLTHKNHVVVAMKKSGGTAHLRTGDAAELVDALTQGGKFSGLASHPGFDDRLHFKRDLAGDMHWAVVVFFDEPDITWLSFWHGALCPEALRVDEGGRGQLAHAVLELLHGSTEARA